MANQGYFIISDAQYSILQTWNMAGSVTDIEGNNCVYHCVSDWYAIQAELIDKFDATWEDLDETNDVGQDQYDIIEASVQYMYYSAETRTWFPA